MFDITLKLTADNTGRVKLGWTINGFEDGVETGYFVERSNLVTASNEVRKCLRNYVRTPRFPIERRTPSITTPIQTLCVSCCAAEVICTIVSLTLTTQKA